MFRVDVRGARQILAQLPRLIARDLPGAEARKLAVRLREVGGVAHVCGSGQKPDFDAVSAAGAARVATAATADAAAVVTEAKSADSAVAAAVVAAPAARSATTKKVRRTSAQRSEADEQAVTAARAAQDAAMANWPDADAPCAWEASDRTPPLVPRPIRHSAARVGWTLVIVLAVVGGGAGAFWMRFGRDVLAVSIAEPHEAPKRRPQPATAAQSDLARSRFALAQELAVATGAEAFRALAARVAKALDDDGEPLRIENQVVGVSFEVREDRVQAQLEALHVEVHGESASLLRHVKGSRVGYDRLALLPTADVPTVVQLMGTAGAGLTTSDIVTWLQALHAARALRLLGAGERFVEGRYAVPMTDGSELDESVFGCPGAPAPTRVGSGAGIAGALKSIRRGERFACEWTP